MVPSEWTSELVDSWFVSCSVRDKRNQRVATLAENDRTRDTLDYRAAEVGRILNFVLES